MSVVQIEWAQDQYEVSFKYDAQIVAAIKLLPSRKWDAARKVWLVKDSPQFRSFIAGAQVEATVGASAVLAGEQPPLGKIRQEGPRLILESQYDARLVEAVRLIEGRKWDKEIKCWKFPLTSVRKLKTLCNQFGLVWAIVSEVPDSEPVTVPIVKVKGGQFLVFTNYDRDVLDAVKEIAGVEWDRWESAFRIPIDCVVEVDEFVKKHNGVWDDSAVGVVKDASEILQMFKASSATTAELEIIGLGGKLMPFQAAGVLYALSALGKGPHTDLLKVH